MSAPSDFLATRYRLLVVPPDHPLRDRGFSDIDMYDVTVEWRGDDRWAVCCMGRCADIDGDLDYEPQPSSREDEWLAMYRFSLDECWAIARKVAAWRLKLVVKQIGDRWPAS